MGVRLNLSKPYNLDIPQGLDGETLRKLDPIQLERGRFLSGSPVGAKTIQNYTEETLKPEIGKQLWGKQIQFQKESTANAEILGQETIALGKEQLKVQQQAFKNQMISKAIGDAIKAAGMAYGGYSMNAAAAAEKAGIVSPEQAQANIIAKHDTGVQEILPVKTSFFSTPWGGAALAAISPTAFGVYYVTKIYGK